MIHTAKKASRLFGIILLAFALHGCGSDRRSLVYREFTRWLNDPENNLSQTRYVNGIKITAKYMPPELLAYREMEGGPLSQKRLDSLTATKKGTVTYLLSIGPDERRADGHDIMTGAVSGYPEFAERALAMNFNMDEYVTLKAGGRDYKPLLHTLENVYGLAKQRNIVLVFPAAAEGKKDASYELSFNDMIFVTGIHHFRLNSADLESIPRIQL